MHITPRVYSYTSIIVLLLLSTSLTIAQGVIKGKVIDEGSGETLIGAYVVLEGTTDGTATDLDGGYSLSLQQGTYNLVYSYTGYPEKRVEDIVVENGQVTFQDVVLSDSEGVALDIDVTVTAERLTNTEVAVLLERKEALTISDNLSVQEMSRYGASEASGALRKVTGTSVENGKYIFVRGLGDRYSLSQLNGLVIPSTDPYRNSAQLDLIPTSLIDNISTAKTFTPDQPGSFTGGNVDIRTKKFPDLPTFTVSVTAGYNSQSNLIDNFLTHQGGDYEYLGYDNARGLPAPLQNTAIRDLQSNRSEGLARRNGNQEAAEALDAGIKSVIPQVAPTTTNSFLDHGLSLAYGNKFNFGNNILGLIATASFKQDYQHLENFRQADWRILFDSDAELQNQGDLIADRSTLNPTLSGLVGLAYRIGQNNEISLTSMYNHTTEKTSRMVVGERPDNIFLPRQLQGFQLSFIEQDLINIQLGGEHRFPQWNGFTVEWRASQVNSSQYEPQTRFFENILNVETGRYGGPGGADINQPLYFWRDLQDQQYTAKLDLIMPLAKRGNTIKVGGYYSTKDRTSTEDQLLLNTTVAAQDLEDLGGDQNALVAFDNIGILDRSEGTGRYVIGNYLNDNTLPQNTYDGEENISAVYGMLTYQLRKNLKFVGGLRMEVTDLQSVSRDTSLPIGSVSETDFLPSLGLIYEATEGFNIRGNYSRTLARPNMREISTFIIQDPLLNIFERGNPDSLGRSLIDNYDLRLEYFLGGNELIALSGYYKNFTDPIVRQQIASANNEFQFINTSSGYLFGIEFELRKSLAFLTDKFSNLSLVTNASYILSEVETGAVSERDPGARPFPGQPDYIINTALNYVQPELGWDVALSANFVGDRLNAIGSGNRLDRYDRARTQLDFVASKQFGPLRVRVGVLNILDDPYTISTDYKGNEFIYSDFRRGVDFRFGVSYNIGNRVRLQ